MKKILNDTLKGPSGRYSRKSLTMLTSFSISIILGLYIVFSDRILNKEINRYAIDVFSPYSASCTIAPSSPGPV